MMQLWLNFDYVLNCCYNNLCVTVLQTQWKLLEFVFSSLVKYEAMVAIFSSAAGVLGACVASGNPETQFCPDDGGWPGNRRPGMLRQHNTKVRKVHFSIIDM